MCLYQVWLISDSSHLLGRQFIDPVKIKFAGGSSIGLAIFGLSSAFTFHFNWYKWNLNFQLYVSSVSKYPTCMLYIIRTLCIVYTKCTLIRPAFDVNAISGRPLLLNREPNTIYSASVKSNFLSVIYVRTKCSYNNRGSCNTHIVSECQI